MTRVENIRLAITPGQGHDEIPIRSASAISIASGAKQTIMQAKRRGTKARNETENETDSQAQSRFLRKIVSSIAIRDSTDYRAIC